MAINILRMAALAVAASAFVASASARRLAPVVEQQLEGRSTYLGGWPLAAISCPVEAPVSCTTNDGSINQNCCPSGNTCLGQTSPYCCPSSIDCEAQVKNLPICSNSTWDMFGLDDNSKFFCCEPGQIGVIPLSGYAGVCESADQVVPVSLRATMISQIGGTAVVPMGTAAASASGIISSPAITTSNGATITKGASITNTQGGTYSTSTGSLSSTTANTVTSAIKLSLGAIIGIAVGGFFLMVVLLSLAVWCCCCRGRRRRLTTNVAQEPYSNAYAPPMPNNVVYGAPPQQQMYGPSPTTYHSGPYDPMMERGLSPGTEYKTLSPEVGSQYTGVSEISGHPSPYGRSEM